MSSQTADSTPLRRHDRLLQEWVHDTYKSKSKLPEPTTCPDCGAVYREGRWQWAQPQAGAHQACCPACHRIRDNCPAGFLEMEGEFLNDHREEILSLIRHVEEREKAEHPLKRIIAVEAQNHGFLVSFTDPHLARGAGEAIEDAYQGCLEYAYQEAEQLLRVRWFR